MVIAGPYPVLILRRRGSEGILQRGLFFMFLLFVGYHRFPAPGVWLRDGMDAGECPVVWMDVGWIALFQFVKTVISGEFMPEASLL